jgi:demethylmenaquinone methyltransferase/2-methoxy-6-polyprenyl-1,4-benzoquinol methylase
MVSPHDGDLAADFLVREWARKDEFSRIWQDRLDDVFTDIAPYYDVASNVASLGVFNRWRRQFILTVDIKPGDSVLDVCAGTNGVGIELLRKQPDIHVVAIDRSRAMQEVGRDMARALGFRIESTIGDAHHLPFPNDSFDVVTLQWASRHLRIVDVFGEIRRVLKPGGRFYHCDMLRPERKSIEVLYSAYLKACLLTTAFAFRCGPEAWSCRDYFVRAIQTFYSAEELTDLLAGAGFSEISCKKAIGGIVAAHRAVAYTALVRAPA